MFCLLRGFRQKDIKTYFFLFFHLNIFPPSLGEGLGVGLHHSISPIPLALRYSLQREN